MKGHSMTDAEWKKTRAYVEEVQMERREQERQERERHGCSDDFLDYLETAPVNQPVSTTNVSALATAFIVLCLFFMTLGGVTTILKEREVRKVMSDDARRDQLEELDRMGRKLDAMDEKLDRILSHLR